MIKSLNALFEFGEAVARLHDEVMTNRILGVFDLEVGRPDFEGRTVDSLPDGHGDVYRWGPLEPGQTKFGEPRLIRRMRRIT